MTVYIEDCLIENFAVTFLVLKCVSACYKLQLKKSKLILACVLGAVISTVYPLLNFGAILSIMFKLVVGMVLVLVAFDCKNYFAKYITFIFFTALYGGLNILIYYLIYGTLNIQDNFPTYILLSLLFTLYFLINQCLSFAKKRLAISNFVYSVKITNDGKEICVSAFLDSGNTLLDTDLMPIFIINAKLFNKLYNNISFADLLTKDYKNLKQPHYIKSGFASGSGKILVICVDNVKILNNGIIKSEINNAKLGISYAKFNKNFNCDMLLNICAFS